MAKVTFRFDGWKDGQVAPSTIELPVVRPKVEEKARGGHAR
jgi:hypothetical protein